MKRRIRIGRKNRRTRSTVGRKRRIKKVDEGKRCEVLGG